MIERESKRSVNTQKVMKIKSARARADSDDDVPLARRSLSNENVGWSFRARARREREDKIKAEQGGLAGTPLNNASASVYEGEQREEKSSAPSIKHRVHYTEAGAGLWCTRHPRFLRVWGEIRERERGAESGQNTARTFRRCYQDSWIPWAHSASSSRQVTATLIFSAKCI